MNNEFDSTHQGSKSQTLYNYYLEIRLLNEEVSPDRIKFLKEQTEMLEAQLSPLEVSNVKSALDVYLNFLKSSGN
jgi:hypothetical protein